MVGILFSRNLIFDHDEGKAEDEARRRPLGPVRPFSGGMDGARHGLSGENEPLLMNEPHSKTPLLPPPKSEARAYTHPDSPEAQSSHTFLEGDEIGLMSDDLESAGSLQQRGLGTWDGWNDSYLGFKIFRKRWWMKRLSRMYCTLLVTLAVTLAFIAVAFWVWTDLSWEAWYSIFVIYFTFLALIHNVTEPDIIMLLTTTTLLAARIISP